MTGMYSQRWMWLIYKSKPNPDHKQNECGLKISYRIIMFPGAKTKTKQMTDVSETKVRFKTCGWLSKKKKKCFSKAPGMYFSILLWNILNHDHLKLIQHLSEPQTRSIVPSGKVHGFRRPTATGTVTALLTKTMARIQTSRWLLSRLVDTLPRE